MKFQMIHFIFLINFSWYSDLFNQTCCVHTDPLQITEKMCSMFAHLVQALDQGITVEPSITTPTYVL